MLLGNPLGPTHDDLTYESVGKCFNRNLIPHEPTVSKMKEHWKISMLNDSQMQMALLPNPDEVINAPNLWVPLARVSNVLILPGVPRLFRSLLDEWFTNYLSNGALPLQTDPKFRVLIKTNLKEQELAQRLKEIQQDVIIKGIDIGSYPKLLDDGQTYVVISIIGSKKNVDLVESVVSLTLEQFKGVIIAED